MRVLIDSSVWIDFFKGAPAAVSSVDALLASDRAAIAGPVFAEVVSGARTRNEFATLSTKLAALRWLEPPPEVWSLVAETRFTLARQGVQAHLVDLVLAHTAYATSCELLTRDRDFEHIAQVLAFGLQVL